jgi:hypothetical protein
MKNQLFKITCFSMLVSIFLSSCVKENFGEPTAECVEPSLVKNKTVEEIYTTNNIAVPLNTYGYSATDPNLGENDVIEAYVTSSDEGGNFFKTISFVSTDGVRGFSMSIDQYNLYNDSPISLKPGRKVYVKLKGLYVARPTGGAIGLVMGGKPSGSFNTLSRLPVYEYKKYLFPTCKVVDEEQIVNKEKTVAGVKTNLTIADVLDDSYLNKLIEVSDVQFRDDFAGGTYDPNRTDTSDTNTYLTTTTNPLEQIVVRTSSFANFAGNKIPRGSGKIRGVLTKFGGTYQIILRTERDVKLTNKRVGDYINEAFTTSLGNWTTYSVSGAQVWSQIPNFGNPLGCAKMTGFASGSNANEDWLISPIQDLSDVTTASLGFDNAYKFTGAPIKVLISKNYSGTGDPNLATWTDLSAGITLSAGNYVWASSGPINITAYTGVGNNAIYVAFKYTSTSTESSTWEIDNPKITAN